ncbi:MAG: hypothetical protein PHQ85_09770, partial [Eubacteriales bacterium]|nr:hypothetical protein [Eubacteriales bacterium]
QFHYRDRPPFAKGILYPAKIILATSAKTLTFGSSGYLHIQQEPRFEATREVIFRRLNAPITASVNPLVVGYTVQTVSATPHFLRQVTLFRGIG